MLTTAANAHFEAWTPEELMQYYNAEPRGVLLVRLAEWYKNAELETKINQYRLPGKPIQNPNLFATLKRGYEIIASRDGHLPTEWRLQYDKRKVENLAKRFGEKDKSVSMLRKSIKARDSRKVIVLPDKPTLEQLDEARPERGRDPGFAFESRDYWVKLVAASEYYTKVEIARVFSMGVSVFHDELCKAKRLVQRFAELSTLEARGIAIPQTYDPPASLVYNQTLFTPVAGYLGIVRPELSLDIAAGSQSAKRDQDSALGLSPVSATLHPPVSLRIRRSLYHLRDNLIQFPHHLTSLATIANSVELLAPDTTYENEAQRLTTVSCETVDTLTAYRELCATSNRLETYGVERLARCIAWAIDVWMEHADDCADRGEAVHATFLESLLSVLWNIEEVEAEMEYEEARNDKWAEEVMEGDQEDEGIAMDF